jgi:hypothetical protein
MLSFYAKDKKKYLSSPKEAFRTAKAAVLGASTLFKASFWGDFGCCQVLPSLKPMFIKVSGFSMVLHNVCSSVRNASILGAFCYHIHFSYKLQYSKTIH